VVFGDFFVERSLAAPFTGGGGLSTNGLPNAPSFAGLDIFVSGDDLELYARDWENKPFTLYVGYEGDDWANFEVYVTGKTIGHSLIDDGIQVDLSINPTGTDKLFPVNRFDDGRVKPFAFGSIVEVTPAKLNSELNDGLWVAHSGTSLTTSDTENTTPPFALADFVNGQYFGDIDFSVRDSTGTSTSATNAKPADVSEGTGSIAFDTDHILLTLPSQSGVGTADNCTIVIESEDTVESGLYYDVEMDIELSSDSTVDECTVSSGGSFIAPAGAITNSLAIRKGVQTVRKLLRPRATGSDNVKETLYFYKDTALNAETIELKIYAIRCMPRKKSSSLTIITGENDKQYRLPTYRVADANISASFPEFIAVYDDTGLIKIADNNSTFKVTFTGDTTNNDLVAACQYISTQANGSESPITSSITSPDIGVYCDTAKPIFKWWQEWCDPLDIYLDVSETTSTIDLKRRFNGTVFDADGTLNVIDAFSFTEDDIANLKQLPNEPSVSKYEVSYKYNHTSPNESPTVTNLNPFARLNQVKRIDTPLVSTANATTIAELNNRDGKRRSFYQFEIAGAGHGLSPNDTGKISHSRIKDGGLFTIRFVREYPLQKKTLIKGVKHG